MFWATCVARKFGQKALRTFDAAVHSCNCRQKILILQSCLFKSTNRKSQSCVHFNKGQTNKKPIHLVDNVFVVTLHTVPQPAGRLMVARPGSYPLSGGPILPGHGWPQDNGAHTEPPLVMSEISPALDPDNQTKTCYLSK